MPTKDRTTEVKEAMLKIVENFKDAQHRIDWVKCSACDEEWTKLAPCRVFIDVPGQDKKKIMVTHLCVSCAETPFRLKDISFRFPLEVGHEGLEFSKRLPISFKNLDLSLISPKMWIVNVQTSDSFAFQVECKGERIFIKGTGIDSENTISFDNSVAAWFWLKNRFENGENVGPIKKW